MQIKPRNYPHPVLSHFSDDIVESTFSSTFGWEVTEASCIFTASLDTNNREIADLAEQGKAVYAYHVECSQTRFRELFRSDRKSFVFKIPSDKLEGLVELTPLIIAAERIPAYKNEKFNKDYEARSFDINKGDIIAVGQGEKLTVTRDYDPLKKISSIFSVQPNSSAAAPPIEVNIDWEKVVIKLPKESFERYGLLKKRPSLRTTLSSLLIVPTLVHILNLLKELYAEEDLAVAEYEKRRWFQVLDLRMQKLGFDIRSLEDDTLFIAQQIIGNPLTKALSDLEEFVNESEGELNVS